VLTSNDLFQKEGRAAKKLLEKLAADGLEKFQRAQGDRFRQERQWYLNLAFYYGNHYVKFKDAGSRTFDMYVPPAPYYVSRPVINQIRRVMRKEMARLTAQQPNAYVVPSSMEDRDIFAAQAGEQIWQGLWRKHHFNRILRQAVFWQSICGNGFIKQYWDKDATDPDNPETPGDIIIKAETPFHVFVPDLKEENLEDQPYLIHVQLKTQEWVRNNLGVEPSDEKLSIVEESMLSVMGINQQNQRKDIALVLEVWIKPGTSTDFPDGGMYTIASNQVVSGMDGWPYEHKQYPFAKLDAVPTGKFYSDSIITDLIPIQRELNRTRAQIIEAKNRMAKPQLLAEQGSIDPRKITTEPGQVITYKAGFTPPQPLAMQNLPSYVENEVNRLYTDISDLSGQHEVSQGQTPPGVTAAVAISYLQEQDETLIASHFDSIEDVVEKVASQCLTYAHTYWDEGRTVKMVGLDSSFDVRTFKGSDLAGNTDIRTEAGSALPTSRAAKQAFITDLMKMGFIDPQEGLEVLEIGGLNRIYERVQTDIRQVQRENLKLSIVTEQDLARYHQEWQQKNPAIQKDPQTGMSLDPPLIIPVNTFDNHELHIEHHNRYRKSQVFEMASDLTKALFEEHVSMHKEAIMVGAAGQIPADLADPLSSGMPGEEQPEEVPSTEELPAQPPEAEMMQ
jgi:hypothetical protein